MSLTNDLIGHWTFDNGDATASVGVDGTNNGGSFESANGRTVVSLASGDYIQIDNAGVNFTTEDFSAAFWFYNEGSAGDWAALISTQNDVGGNGYGWAIHRYYGDDTLFTVQTGNGGPYWSNNHPSQFTIPLNAWTHVVLTRVGTEMKIYLNGADSGYTGTSYATIAHASDELRIARHLHMAATSPGKYDDVRVYSRALSAADVANLYAATTVADLTDGLVAKYALDTDGSDSVGDNDGTNQNVTFADGAAQFNGSDARFTLAGEPFTASDADYTISVWAMHNNLSSTQRLLGWGDTNGRYFVGYHTGRDHIYIGMGDIDIDPTVAYKPVAGQVEHWVFSNSGNTTKFYKDGVLIDTVVHGATGAISAGVGMRIGSVYMEYGEYLNGSMDDLRIWDRQLSDAEVAALYAAGAEEAAAAPPAGSTVDVTFLMQDSYGDGWNGSTFQIYDADSNIVESHTLAGGSEQTVQFTLDAEPYTWAFVNQSWMSEITATLTRDDTSEQLLFSQAGSVLSGAFDLTPATADISPTLSSSNGVITISVDINTPATDAGATGWAYALTDIFVEGQAHGGTAMSVGASATETPTPYGVHTVYVAAINDAGLVVVANSASIDNSPTISVDIIKNDTYGDGWNGTMLVINNSSGVEVYNATMPATNQANQAITYTLDAPYDTYSWSLVGGQYPEEQIVTISLNADGTVLAHSAAHSPSSGSFVVGPPSAGISASASVSGPDITVTGTANATAVSEGAANWSASLTEYGEVGATIDGAKALTGLGVDAVLTVASGGSHTVYVAVVDAAGAILAKSSVDASVFISKLAVSDQMVVMAYLAHPSLSPVENGNPYITNPEGDPEYGPFYIGDLTIKTMVAEIEDPDELVTIVTFDDGSGGTLDVNALVKELIKKYDLNELDGDNAADGAFFQAIVDGTNGIQAADLLAWDGEDTNTVLLSNPGGGFSADYDIRFVPHFPNSGDMSISEVPAGTGVISGPDGGSYVGTIAPGETEPGPEQGPMAVEGYFPIYTTQVGSDMASPVGNSHTHGLSGVNYYMPNGIPGGLGGGLQFHGDFPPDALDVEGYYPLYLGEDIANEISPVGTSHSHTLGGSSADYIDNMIVELDFTDGMSGVSSVGSPSYSVQTINGQERNTIDVSGGQLLVDNMIADYVANRQSTDQMTISFWFKHNGNDDWIVSDMFGIGGGVQSKFRLTLDGRFTSVVRLNVGLGPFSDWHLATGGITYNGVGMQGNPLSHGQWHHVSMVYDETAINGGDTGDITLYFDGVKTASGYQQGWGGLGADGLDELVNAGFFCIGGRSTGDQVFNGELSHFVVHGRALSEAEIAELMGALPGAAAGTTYYMPDGLTMGVDQFHGDYDPNAPADNAGVYDWSHGGNLTNIVKFSRGSSASGAASYGYAKKEDNGTTTLYFATDLQDWETFGTYDASSSGIDGNPVCMEYGPNGKVFVGTDNGKIYEVTLDGDSVPNTFVPLYTMPGGESINTVKYGVTSGEWIFEAAGKMYTIPVDGFVATERYALPAGAKCVDIAEADDGIAMILRKADFSLEPRFALANWANIVGPAGMSTDMANLGATDLNYSYAIDRWVASSADGTTLTTADLITFLTA